jgi:molecular chaperone HtpG
VSEILNEKDDKRKATLSKQLVDLAKLSQGLLKGKDLADFVKRSVEIIK